MTDINYTSAISAQLVPFQKMELFYLVRSLNYLIETPLFSNEKWDLKFGQSACLAFQNTQVRCIYHQQQTIFVDIKGFGLLGPNGALPLHLSEAIYEKKIYQKDHALNDFLNIFQHRLISVFYKSWEYAQDVISLDKKDQWTFSRYVSSLIGADEQQHKLDYLNHYARLYYSSFLLNKNLPVQNLERVLNLYFNLPIKIQQNIGQWIDAYEHKTYLGDDLKLTLGQGLLIGERFFDASQRFRIQIGPISPEKYVKFLFYQYYAKQLLFWVEQYAHYQYQWDIELIVDKTQIEPLRLGQNGMQLGQTSWIGYPQEHPRIITPHH